MSEKYLISQAAPTLAGLKTGNLFPCSYSSWSSLLKEIRAVNRLLSFLKIVKNMVQYENEGDGADKVLHADVQTQKQEIRTLFRSEQRSDFLCLSRISAEFDTVDT